MTRTASTLAAAALAAVLTAPLAAEPVSGPAVVDLTPQFRSASLPVDRLQVYEVGGVVLIRGRAANRGVAEDAGRIAQSLGYTRVANLIQVVAPPDDKAIARRAERELAMHRGLDGCQFMVDSRGGIVTLNGKVASDQQRDLAVSVLRSIDGVRDVRFDDVERVERR